jgi:hypothetical protein
MVNFASHVRTPCHAMLRRCFAQTKFATAALAESSLLIMLGGESVGLVWLPVWMAGEQPVDESNLVADKQAKGQTQHSGASDKAAVQPREPVSGE